MSEQTKEKSPTAMAAGGKRAFRPQDVQRIREVRISSELDFDEVNHLLASGWTLLEVYKPDKGRVSFILATTKPLRFDMRQGLPAEKGMEG